MTFDSHYPLEHKLGVMKTPQADNVPSSSQSKDKKCKHLRRAQKHVVTPIRPLSKQQQDSAKAHDKQAKRKTKATACIVMPSVAGCQKNSNNSTVNFVMS